MTDSRTTHGLGEHPGARFRCVVCQRFVKATERGVCPRCGFKPPTLTPEGRRDPRVWRRAARKARAFQPGHGRGSLWLLLVAAILAATIAVLAR